MFKLQLQYLYIYIFFLLLQFVSLGEQQNFGIKTAGLEDKATACQMLVCYARELKEHFVEYTEQTVKLMVPMLKVILQNIYKWHENNIQYNF